MMKSGLRRARLTWSGEGLSFTGGPEGVPAVTIDGDRGDGPSPMDTLLLALAGCMAIDVRYVLEKSRVPLTALEVEIRGRHAEEIPRKFTHIELLYLLDGPGAEHRPRVDRAIELSRDKYCSVLHSLDPAIAFSIEVEVGGHDG